MRSKPVQWGPSPHLTAPAIIRGRPMCATEINKYLNRSATSEERKAYGRWRSNNPNVDLETGEIIERAPEPDPIDLVSMAYDRLGETLGWDKAEVIRNFVEAVLESRK